MLSVSLGEVIMSEFQTKFLIIVYFSVKKFHKEKEDWKNCFYEYYITLNCRLIIPSQLFSFN